MKIHRLFVGLFVLTFLAAEAPEDKLLNLADVPEGKLPQDWIAAKTGQGPGSV